MSLSGESDLVTPEDVARDFRIPVNTQKTWRSRDRLGWGRLAIKLGSKVFYRRTEVEALIEKSRALPAEPSCDDVPAVVAEAWHALRVAKQSWTDARDQYKTIVADIRGAKDAIAAPVAFKPDLEALQAREQRLVSDAAVGDVTKEELIQCRAERADAEAHFKLLVDAARTARERLPELESELVIAGTAHQNEDRRVREAELAFARAVAKHFETRSQEAQKAAFDAEALALAAEQHARNIQLDQTSDPFFRAQLNPGMAWARGRFFHGNRAENERALANVKRYMADVAAALESTEDEARGGDGSQAAQ